MFIMLLMNFFFKKDEEENDEFSEKPLVSVGSYWRAVLVPTKVVSTVLIFKIVLKL